MPGGGAPRYDASAAGGGREPNLNDPVQRGSMAKMSWNDRREQPLSALGKVRIVCMTAIRGWLDFGELQGRARSSSIGTDR